MAPSAFPVNTDEIWDEPPISFWRFYGRNPSQGLFPGSLRIGNSYWESSWREQVWAIYSSCCSALIKSSSCLFWRESGGIWVLLNINGMTQRERWGSRFGDPNQIWAPSKPHSRSSKLPAKCKQQNWRKHLVWGFIFRQVRLGENLAAMGGFWWLIIPTNVAFSPKKIWTFAWLLKERDWYPDFKLNTDLCLTIPLQLWAF